MPLLRNGRRVEDRWIRVAEDAELPAEGAVLLGLTRWLAERSALLRRCTPLGVALRSDEHPEQLTVDLPRLALIALDFPTFKDGRAYTYARLLRERWGFTGELRATGDVLPDQFHFMLRVGFDSFEPASVHALAEWQAASRQFSAWYQATGDGREPAGLLRHVDLRSRRRA